MTLLDFCRLIRKNLALFIALPVVFALACLGYLFIGHSDDAVYTASSRIVVSTHAADVSGLAAGQARAYTNSDEGIDVTQSVDFNAKTVTIIVSSPDEEQSINIANEVAEAVLAESRSFLPDNPDDPFNGRIEPAEEAAMSGSTDALIKYLAAAILAGLFVAVCLILIVNALRRPIRSIDNIQDRVELPVLETIPVSDGGERLLANIRFASKRKEVSSICLIPANDDSSVCLIRELLENALKTEQHSSEMVIKCEDSLSKSMKAAYTAREVDAAVLVATAWKDSMRDLESSAAELKLADANLVGIVLVES